mgnify:CR=1 FL=1
MPPAVLAQLRALGENLAIARKRRRESVKSWAQRIGVSEPTLARMVAWYAIDTAGPAAHIIGHRVDRGRPGAAPCNTRLSSGCPKRSIP